MTDPEPLFTLYGVIDGIIVQPRCHDVRNRGLRWIGWVLPRGVPDPGTVGLDRITALVNTHGGMLLQVSPETPDGTRSFSVTLGSGNGYVRPNSFYQMMSGDARLTQEPLTTGEIPVASDVRVFIPASADSDRLLGRSQDFLEGLTAPQAQAVIEVLRDPEEFARLIALGRAARNGPTQGTAKSAAASHPKIATPKPKQVATKPPPKWPDDAETPRQKPPSGRGRFPLWAKLGVASVMITLGAVAGYFVLPELWKRSFGEDATGLTAAWSAFGTAVTEHPDHDVTGWKVCTTPEISAKAILACPVNRGTFYGVTDYLLSKNLDLDPYVTEKWSNRPGRGRIPWNQHAGPIAAAGQGLESAANCFLRGESADPDKCRPVTSDEAVAKSLAILTAELNLESVAKTHKAIDDEFQNLNVVVLRKSPDWHKWAPEDGEKADYQRVQRYAICRPIDMKFSLQWLENLQPATGQECDELLSRKRAPEMLSLLRTLSGAATAVGTGQEKAVAPDQNAPTQASPTLPGPQQNANARFSSGAPGGAPPAPPDSPAAAVTGAASAHPAGAEVGTPASDQTTAVGGTRAGAAVAEPNPPPPETPVEPAPKTIPEATSAPPKETPKQKRDRKKAEKDEAGRRVQKNK